MFVNEAQAWLLLLLRVCSVAESYPTLCNPMDCSPPGSSIHRIFRARILEWVAISSFRGSSRLRDGTHVSCVSCIGRWILHYWVTWEALLLLVVVTKWQFCNLKEFVYNLQWVLTQQFISLNSNNATTICKIIQLKIWKIKVVHA